MTKNKILHLALLGLGALAYFTIPFQENPASMLLTVITGTGLIILAETKFDDE